MITIVVTVAITIVVLAVIGQCDLRRERARSLDADLRQAEHQLFLIASSAFKAMTDEARRSQER